MKLFEYETYEDYGKEWFFQILTFRRFALLDMTVQWDEYTDEQIEEWNKEDLLEVPNKETFFDVVHYNFWMIIGSIAERLFVRMK